MFIKIECELLKRLFVGCFNVFQYVLDLAIQYSA